MRFVRWASSAIWEYGHRTWELQQQHEQEHSVCVEGDLTTLEKDNSTSDRSNQVCGEQKMCRWCEPSVAAQGCLPPGANVCVASPRGGFRILWRGWRRRGSGHPSPFWPKSILVHFTLKIYHLNRANWAILWYLGAPKGRKWHICFIFRFGRLYYLLYLGG